MASDVTAVYSVFGAADDSHPYVKVELLPARVPDAEVTNEIIEISVKAYGDSPRNPFVTVTGYDEQKTVQAWFRAVAETRPEEWYE